jgi:acetyltransferase-like isoleucine patch superfamily enzyme
MLASVITKILKKRNPNSYWSDDLNTMMLWEWTWDQMIQLIRGLQCLFYLRRPNWMLRGRGVRLCNVPKIKWGRFVRIGQSCKLVAMGTGEIRLGHRVSIGDNSYLIISTTPMLPGAFIHIDDQVGIGEFAYLGGAGGLHIGRGCIIGQYLSCHPENHIYDNVDEEIRLQGVTRRGIVIGPNCWIGSKVTILDGVTIGEGCVIAAGAVVNKDIPAYSVIGGVPAKIIKSRKPDAMASQLNNSAA